jgi:hypothetical protein
MNDNTPAKRSDRVLKSILTSLNRKYISFLYKNNTRSEINDRIPLRNVFIGKIREI